MEGRVQPGTDMLCTVLSTESVHNWAGLIASPLRGPAGNVEFLIWLRRSADVSFDLPAAITAALATAPS